MGIVDEVSILSPKSGETVVVRIRSLEDKKRVPHLMAQLMALHERWEKEGRNVDIVLIDRSTKIETLSEDEMKENGWVRAVKDG